MNEGEKKLSNNQILSTVYGKNIMKLVQEY